MTRTENILFMFAALSKSEQDEALQEIEGLLQKKPSSLRRCPQEAAQSADISLPESRAEDQSA